MKLDLHTHSTASDGQYRPAELVEMAKEKELEMPDEYVSMLVRKN